jgi:hypothetical protein
VLNVIDLCPIVQTHATSGAGLPSRFATETSAKQLRGSSLLPFASGSFREAKLPVRRTHVASRRVRVLMSASFLVNAPCGQLRVSSQPRLPYKTR